MVEKQQKIANLLIIIGVLAWAPYLFLLARGDAPSIFPFLAVHLSGVLSGGWLRARSRQKKLEKGRRRKVFSRILIVLGVLVWVPYFYVTRVQGIDQAIGPFLAAHLTGVLGGSALRLSLEVEKLLKQDEKVNKEPSDSQGG